MKNRLSRSFRIPQAEFNRVMRKAISIYRGKPAKELWRIKLKNPNVIRMVHRAGKVLAAAEGMKRAQAESVFIHVCVHFGLPSILADLRAKEKAL